MREEYSRPYTLDWPQTHNLKHFWSLTVVNLRSVIIWSCKFSAPRPKWLCVYTETRRAPTLRRIVCRNVNCQRGTNMLSATRRCLRQLFMTHISHAPMILYTRSAALITAAWAPRTTISAHIACHVLQRRILWLLIDLCTLCLWKQHDNVWTVDKGLSLYCV